MAINYHFNEKTNVTTSLLLNCEDDFKNKLENIINNKSKYFKLNEKNHKNSVNIKMNHVYLSRIKLHGNDVDDCEKSQEISKKKTLKNYYDAYDRRVIAILKDLKCIESAIMELAENNHIDIPEELR